MKALMRVLGGIIALSLLWPATSHAFLGNEDAATGSDYEPTRLIVKFTPETELNLTQARGLAATGVAEIDELHQKYAVSRQQALLEQKQIRSSDNPLRGVYILEVGSGTDIEAMAEEYSRLDAVQFAEPDYLMQLHDVPDDPLLAQQWALNNTAQGHYHVDRLEGDFNDTVAVVYGTADADIDAAEVFDNPPDNTNTVVVAIIDTGFDYVHPDLVGMAWSNPGEIPDNGIDDNHNGYIDDAVGWDFSGNDDGIPIWEDNNPTDPMGHGTHCAGIVASVINNATGICGVVPEARIMSLKCYPMLLFSLVAKSIVYATDNGADVISMSFGGWFPSDVVWNALKYARAHNVVLVSSAGNSGCYCGSYPAIHEEVFSVSASNDSDHVTSWSSYNDSVDVCAPGQSILSLRATGTDMYASHDEPDVHVIDEYYYLASGTSMSCPYTAAVAAYLRAISAGLTVEKVLDIIGSTAYDIIDPYGLGESFPGKDIYTGYGRINVANALAARPLVRAVLESPANFNVLSGTVDITGSADGAEFTNYVVEYGVGDAPESWIEIASSTSPVTGGFLGTWHTSSLQGRYTVRLRVGDFNVDAVHVYVANAVVAEIQSPTEADTSSGLVDITGNAGCPDFSHILLEVGPGELPESWDTVAIVTIPADNEMIYSWKTGTIEDGLYTLRMTVFSSVGAQASDEVMFHILSPFAGEYGWSVVLDGKSGPFANYGDFDGDGLNEIVVNTDVGIQFFNMDGTPKLTGVPVFPADKYVPMVAVGELDGDGVDDIVAIGYWNKTLYGFPSSAPAFEVLLDPWPLATFTHDELSLKDIDNDGLDEIHYNASGIVGGSSNRYFIYRHDGTSWGHGFPLDSTYAPCFSADLDGDLIDEIYCYNDSSHFLVAFDTVGQAHDSILIEINGLPLVLGLISMHAVDIDLDDKYELVVMGWSMADPYDWSTYSTHTLYAFDEGLVMKDSWPRDTEQPGQFTIRAPVFVDLDSDGTLEYVLIKGDMSSVAIYAWHIDGTPYLGDVGSDGYFASLPNPGGIHGATFVDVDDDYSLDLLTGASQDLWMTYVVERIAAFNSEGELLQGYPIVVCGDVTGKGSSGGCPVSGDLNGDGAFDFIYTWCDQLFFANFPQFRFNPNYSPYPMVRYNRRLNYTAPLASEFTVVCGDMNGSGGLANISDITFYVDYMFDYGPRPPYPDMADVDGSGRLDISDLTYMVDFMFGGGPAPNCP